MQGTIRRNNVLEPMSPYGCWNKPRVRTVRHGGGVVGTGPEWEDFGSPGCNYDRKPGGSSRHGVDGRCIGCLK